jgi:DNA-directed RNA polymerase subunit RPC12/RpoP
MAYKSIMFELTADCPKCGSSLPIPGFVDALPCRRCSIRVPTPPAFWNRVIGEVLTEALAFPEGRGRTGLVRSTPIVKIVYGRMILRCGQCRELLPAMGVAQAAEENASHIYCPFCGHPNSVRRVPPWFSAIHPGAVALVNEALSPPAIPEKDRVFHCFSCGALVPADPTGTNTRCHVCGERVTIPGTILRKMIRGLEGPARFFVLIDMGEAIGVMPRSVRLISDFGIEPYGRMVIAWHPDTRTRSDPRPRITLVDARGLVLWENNELSFSDRTQVHACPVSGHIVVADATGSLWHLDPKNGKTVWSLPSEKSERRLDVTDYRSFEIDADGSLLVCRDFGTGTERLRRFSPEGVRVPLWSGMTIDEEDSPVRAEGTLPHRIREIGAHAFYCCGWDGHTYVVDTTNLAIAKYRRDGFCLGVVTPDKSLFHAIKAIGVDAEGSVSVLFTHAEPIDGVRHDHVARLLPNGLVHIWLGPKAEKSPFPTPPDLGRLKIMPDGTVFFGGTLEQLRIVAPDGEILWESPLASDEIKKTEASNRPRGPNLWG